MKTRGYKTLMAKSIAQISHRKSLFYIGFIAPPDVGATNQGVVGSIAASRTILHKGLPSGGFLFPL